MIDGRWWGCDGKGRGLGMLEHHEREWERALRCCCRWFDEEIDGLKKVDDRWSMVGKAENLGKGEHRENHREREWERTFFLFYYFFKIFLILCFLVFYFLFF